LLVTLRELGYVDGRTVEFQFRFAHNELERLPALAAELVAWGPDVLYTWTSGGARAATAATSTIPIVVAPVAEATMAALVPDFAHPPGNITGLTLTGRHQQEKALQILKEAVTGIRRVGVLFNPLNPAWHGYPAVLNDAARALGIERANLYRKARQLGIPLRRETVSERRISG
jgi:putative ABC transport system substrate-binding protein